MNDQTDDSPPKVPAQTGRSALRSACFEQLHVNPLKRGELWQNRFGKTVFVNFTDGNLEFFWEESLNLALAEKDTQPKKPGR